MIETQFGEIVCDEQEGWGYNGATRIRFQLGTFIVEIDAPRVVEVDEQFPATLELHRRPHEMTPDEAVQLGALMAFTSETARLFNEWNQPLVDAAEQREAEEEQKLKEEQDAKDAITDERKQMLLNELMGETVRVRHSGYRTTAKAVVESRGRNYNDDDEPTEWEPTLRWDSSNNANRARGDVQNWMLLDVKTERGWRNVWDDGKADIGGDLAGTKLPEAKPWREGL